MFSFKSAPLSILVVASTALLTTLVHADELPIHLPKGLDLNQPRNTPPNTDQLIIRFKDTASPEAIDAVLSRMRSEKKEEFAYSKSTPDRSDVFHFKGAKSKADWDKLSEWLKQSPDIDYVEPDYIMTAAVTPAPVMPNDTYLAYQWSLLDDTVGIRAPQAWGYTTGAGGVVAVVDTGILPHADLLPNILPGYDMITDLFTANDGNGRDNNPTDPGDYVLAGECGSTTAIKSSWHGTHVAGTIAAVANNTEGVAGVAYNSKILPVRALGKCGGYTSDIAAGMIWAVGGSVSGAPVNPNPARVINLSLSGTSACSTTFQNAINTARSKNAVVVVAAGNSNTDVSQFSPANCNGVITVAATGRDGGKAYYSDFGALVDVAAPGGSMNTGSANGILSTLNTGTQQALADTYAYYQGTSMATPHVAGIAALMLSANPGLSPDQVETILKTTARAFPAPCTSCGAGLVDATAAVQKALTTAPDPYIGLQSDLTKYQSLWVNSGVVNYTYVLETKVGTATSTRLQLTIKAGKVVSGINLTTNKALTSKELTSKGMTINQIFSAIQTAITGKYIGVTVSYDGTLGYPLNALLDKTSAAGDETSYLVSNFVRQ